MWVFLFHLRNKRTKTKTKRRPPHWLNFFYFRNIFFVSIFYERRVMRRKGRGQTKIERPERENGFDLSDGRRRDLWTTSSSTAFRERRERRRRRFAPCWFRLVWGLLGFFFFTGFFSSEWVPGSTVGHRVFNSFTGFCLFVPRVEWVLPGFTGFFWTLVENIGL